MKVKKRKNASARSCRPPEYLSGDRAQQVFIFINLKVPKGGGSFSIQKFILQIFAIIDDTLVMNFRKNLQYDFPKNEGGGQRPFGTFPKIHPFW